MKIVITVGDPSGCGPFISLKAIESLIRRDINFILVGDYKVLNRFSIFKKLVKKIDFVDLNTKNIEDIKPGFPSYISGEASINYIDTALKIISKENIKALVTAPVSKEAIKLKFSDFVGQTEYLANYFKVKRFEMFMVSKNIKIVLYTRHKPLREVSSLINIDNLKNTIETTYSALKNLFKIKNPKIAIASFNPHAGINTYLEKEEKIIVSAIKKSEKNIFGPFPPDSLFIKENLNKYDCFICLYHDQGMIPFKMLSLDTGVNLTVGLPIIRTSPAHGVAYDIIRAKKIPFFNSMLEAIKLALSLSK